MADPTQNLIRDVLTAMGATPRPTLDIGGVPVSSKEESGRGGHVTAIPALDLNDLERRRALLQELWEDADARWRMYANDLSPRGRVIMVHLCAAKEYAGHALDNARWALEEAQAEATARGEEW